MTTSHRVDRRRARVGHRGTPLIRRASAWRPGAAPETLPLQDLAGAEAIRWVDLHGGELTPSEVAALLDPICHGELTPRMARDLVTPARYPVGRGYGNGEASITAAFSIRRAGEDSPAAVFDPMHLLVGRDWLLTCWLPPRPIRAEPRQPRSSGASSPEALFEAVADGWQHNEGENAGDLAGLVRRELAIACGYRPRI